MSKNRLSITSPFGPITLIEENGFLVKLEWNKQSNEISNSLLNEASNQLKAYFSGNLKDFNLPLNPIGTLHQVKTWKIINEIKYGDYLTYGEISNNIKSSPRAVGNACGKNPLPIIIPCHRVLTKKLDISGYSGKGGAKTKKYLLNLEGIDINT
ncbi:MAG: methylated-DNA--[protein]-cysteine S-methyltransferase [Alphaproteobacteria bacterium]|jgi:methylated-DNA-[protein]-cysteine S-methyltransferase|nr:methylated-DNA--[protein]-cysteine S-methyltransferase [Alphaproteobacteria bacterium]